MRRFGSNLSGRVWQCVATSLLLLLLGALATPFVQAQDPEFGVPPCCRMMAGHMGCSMRLHRAMVQQMVEQYDHSHQFASLQARCPCTPLTQSNVSPHEMPFAATSAELALLPHARATPSLSLERKDVLREGGALTRGPPATLTA